jgi:hypothetical protein
MHNIDTGDHRPIAEPLRTHARVHMDLTDQTVKRLLQANIFAEAASPWSANIVIVVKPGNPILKVTVDYS